LTTRSEDGLVRRLQQRKQDTAEGMALRTATARQEMKRAEEFDFCVVNPENQPEVAVAHVLSIIDAAHCRINQEPVQL
jgi:guanylate kinase